MLKKYLLIIGISLAVCAAVALAFLIPFFNKVPKFSIENISCVATADEIYYSGQKANNTYENYSLEISSLNDIEILNPKISQSSNVKITNKTSVNNLIIISFYISYGTEFEIKTSSDNFETFTYQNTAKPFVGFISLSFYDVFSMNSINLKTENEKQVLYLLKDNTKLIIANSDNYFSYIKYNIITQTNSLDDFEITLSNQNLEINSDTKTIQTKKSGNCNITISAKDGSGYSKVFKFVIKDIKATALNNLPEEINLDLTSNKTYNFNYSVVPEYADFKLESYLIYNEEYLEFDQETNSIKAIKVGETTVYIGLGSINYEMKFIIENCNTNLTYTYNVSLLNQEDGIEFNTTTNTINIASNKFSFSTAITLLIYIEDNNHNTYNFNSTFQKSGAGIIAGNINQYAGLQEKPNSASLVFCINSVGADKITITNSTLDISIEINIICE